MDELAEKLGMDPVELRIVNDAQGMVPGEPDTKLSDRNLTRCLREGADMFGWSKREARPGRSRKGRWLTGMGVAAGYFGGRVDAVMMRIVDILYVLPYMFLVIILVTIFNQSLLPG